MFRVLLSVLSMLSSCSNVSKRCSALLAWITLDMAARMNQLLNRIGGNCHEI
jgi:hypothetical protein